MGKYYLIDGYGFLHAGMHAFSNRPLRGPNGENTSATFIVTNLILRLLREQRPTGLVWVHDAGDSGRKAMYPEYKANRSPMEPQMLVDFRQAKTRVAELAEMLKIPLLTVPGYEADDVIGTLAHELGAAGHEVVVVSNDKDLHQMVSGQVKILQPKKGGSDTDKWWVYGENAEERFGCRPEQVVDYLALLGDASDNVPGVAGIGAKTAVSLLAQYGDLETILAKAGEIKAKRARESLLANGAVARLSRDLVRIQTQVPHGQALESLGCGVADWEKVQAWLLALGFHSIHRALDITQMRAAAEKGTRPKEPMATEPEEPMATEPEESGGARVEKPGDDGNWGAWADL